MTEVHRSLEFFTLSSRTSIVCRLLSVLLLAAAFGCVTDDGRLAFPNRKPLRVGVAPSYPPVIFEENGEILGIEADLAHSIADALGRRAVFSSYRLSELIDALEAGEIDVVMSGLSITPERSKRVRFTAPYMKSGQLALIRSSDLVRLGRKRSIYRRGTRVGYQRGSMGEKFVATNLPLAVSFAFNDVDSGIRSLRAARIDFFVHDAPTIWRLAGDPASRDLHGLYHLLTEEHLAWAVRHDDLKLHTLLDATLSHWKREGRIEPIVNRWIPVRVTVR